MAERTAVLDKLSKEYPKFAEDFSEMQQYFENKLWHQLTVALQRCIERPAFREHHTLVTDLYEDFIYPSFHRFSPWSLATMAVSVSKTYDEGSEAVAFLETGVLERLKQTQYTQTETAKILVMEQVALIHVQEEELDDAVEMLAQIKEMIDEVYNPEEELWASYYLTYSLIHSKRKNFAEFFKSSLQYLCYVDHKSLSAGTQMSLAVDISFAALLGKGIYSFGELILHPLIEVLKGSEYEWLLEMLDAFNRGDLHKYEELCSKYADALNSLPQMVEHERDLREKITILALTELVFSLPSDQRAIPFSKISERTKLDTDGVEFLLMKTLSLSLIKGQVDEVNQVAEVSWVQPRVLTKPQLSALNEKLGEWVSKVEAATRTLEAESLAIPVA